MALPLLGFVIAQLGLRAIPVMLRTGSHAMRYIVTTPGAKGKAMQELAKRVLGKNAIVDDVAKLTSKAKDNPVGKILLETNPNKAGYNKILSSVSAKEKEQLMQIAYRDSSKILQNQKSYPMTAKLAGDIEAGVGQSFSKEASGRLFIAGDRAKTAFKEGIEKATVAPKALPRPTKEAIGPYYTPPVTPLEVAKSGVGTAQITPGLTRLQQGAFRTIKRAEKGKKTIPIKKLVKEIKKVEPTKGNLQIAKDIIRERRTTKSLEGITTEGKVIAEGLKGVGSAPKPAWWQAMIPNVLRVGGQPYKGAYPAGVSAERVGVTTGGLLFAGATIPSLAESMTKKHLAKKDILSVEQIMNAAGDTYGEAYDPNAMINKLESGNVILPERIE